MEVFAPADEAELLAGLPAVLASPAPTYIRFNARRSTLSHTPFSIGRAEVLTEGEHVALLSAGLLVPSAVEAAALLEKDGISARVVNMRTLAPHDEAAVLAAAHSCSLLVTIEDHLLAGGLYSIVCETLVRNQLAPRVLPIGLEARWFRPGRLADVLAHEGFTPEALARRVRQALDKRAGQPANPELQVAELVHDIVPGAEMVRFGKNGCDVTTAAVRVARAFTGRRKVLCCGYHGWHDWYISVTDRNLGIPPEVAALTHTFAYNDLASVEAALDDDTACVILEPTTFEAPRTAP